MTTSIYIRARDPDNGARVVRELLQLGTDPTRLRVVGRRAPADLPVAFSRWRPPATRLAVPALVGALLLPALAIGLYGGLDALAGLMFALVGAAVGAGWHLSLRPRGREPLAAQAQALRRGELMIIADLEESALPRVEAQIAERHPEVLLLGPDPGGSPPFP